MNENKERVEEETTLTPKQEKYFGKEKETEEEECEGEDCPEKEEKEEPVKEWYSNQLHEALLKKFNIKK